MGMKPRVKKTELEPLGRTRVKLDFVIHHRGPIVFRMDWIDVVAAGLRALNLTDAEHIESGARISVSVAPPRKV